MRSINIPAYLIAIATLLWLLSWLIPDHIPPWESFYNEFSAFAALGILLLICLHSSYSKSILIPKHILPIFVLAFIPVVQFGVGLISFSGDGILASFYILAFALSYMVGVIQMPGGKVNFAFYLAALFTTGAVISAFIALYQSLGLSGLEIWINAQGDSPRAHGNVGQPNHLASLLCLGLAGIAYLYTTNRLNSVVSLLITSLLVLAIALTQSRMPWVIAFFALLWWFARGRLISGIPGWGIGYALLLYLTLVLAWPLDTATELSSGVAQRSDLSDPGSRLVIWEGLLRAIWQHPWLGYGWTQVSNAYSQAAINHPLAEMVTYSHNFLIDLLVWNGIPLGLLITFALTWWIFTRALRCTTPENWFGLLAIGMVGVHSLLEYPHAYAYFLLPVGLLAGMVDADQKAVKTVRISRPLVWTTLLIYTTCITLIWHEYRIVEEDYRLARFEERNIGPLKATQPAPDLILLTQLREDLRFMRSRMRENMSLEELAWIQKVAYRYPYFANLFRYSLALALNDKPLEAEAELLRIRNMYGQSLYHQGLATFQILASSSYPQLQPILDSWNIKAD